MQTNGDRYKWVILATLFTTHVLTSLGLFSIPVVLPIIKDSFCLNHAQAGMLTASYFLGIGLMSAIVGLLVDFFGVRKMTIFGTFLLGCSLIAAAWMSGIGFMMFLLISAGTGYSVITPASNTAVMSWFNERVRATAMGFKQTGINGGGFLGGLIVPSLAIALGWRLALSMAGLIVGGAMLLMILLYRDKDTLAHRSLTMSQWLLQVKDVLRNRSILLLSVEGFFRVGVQMAFLTYLVLYLHNGLHLSLVAASLLFAIAQASGGAGRIIWGLVSDRVFRERRKIVYMVISLIAMTFFFLFGQLRPSTYPWIVVIVVSCLSFTAAGHQGVSLTLIGECAGLKLTGTASGISQSFFFLGAMLLSPIFGFIVDTFKSFSTAWSSLAFICLLCLFILCFVNERPKSRERR